MTQFHVAIGLGVPRTMEANSLRRSLGPSGTRLSGLLAPAANVRA